MDRQVFFNRVRAPLFGGVLSAKQVDGLEAIIAAVDDCRLSWVAYVLATAHHETGRTMQPIHEFGGPEYLRKNYDVTGNKPDRARRMGNTRPGDGVRYAGRGYVQLTWKMNYERMGKKLGVDLVGSPDLAMRPDLAARIMRVGMEEGLFTGLSLSDYLKATTTDYLNARRIINGMDKAALIAGHAREYEAALRAAGYVPEGKPAPRPPAAPVVPMLPPDVPAPNPAPAAPVGFWQRFLAAFRRRSKGA
jgi:putative chitinase